MSERRDPKKPPPLARPRPKRLVEGDARAERPVNSGRIEPTADRRGIEIDHESERPAD